MSDSSDTNQFFGDGVFAWQFTKLDHAQRWQEFVYNPQKYWGDFPAPQPGTASTPPLPAWALGPFEKFPSNPVLAPTPGGWDPGRYDGGVHNGSIILHEGRFHYIYRGERPIDIPSSQAHMEYICDIGLAVSDDGINFVKDTRHSPFFRHDDFRKFSYEDVCLVQHQGTFYLFCNQWNWEELDDLTQNGVFLATSTDLRHWHRHGIVFPNAARMHRNGVVLQDPHNQAVQVNGKFVMYINDGLMAYSDDLIHWQSHDIAHRWPGGEGCFAITNHRAGAPEDIVLFTGGHHTGHFYAIGEVLFSKADPEKPLDWLPAPVLRADPAIPYEDGRSAEPPHEPVSSYRDCIFFNGLTRHNGQWWLYYGGGEYYTCLATAPAA